MRGSYIFTATIVLSVSLAFAQSQAAVEENHGSPAKVAHPSVVNSTFFIVAEFTQNLNVKKLKPGAAIKARVAQDVLWHGRILIPFASRLVGHVTEIGVRSRDNPESRLGIVFDKILLNHHREVDFQGVIERLEAPAFRPSKLDEPDQMLPPSFPGLRQGGGISGTSSQGTSGTTQSSIFVDGTPGTNTGDSMGGDLGRPSVGRLADSPATAQPMSTGMPRGIYGIKGLQLSLRSAGTPGPVIVSSEHDVKLEYGTQVLIRATDPHLPQK